MIGLSLLVVEFSADHAHSAGYELYQDAAQPIPARVQDLLSKMTVEEKVHQLYATHTDEKIVRQFTATGVGAAKFMSAFHCAVDDMASCVKARNQLQSDFLNSSRLKIPLSFINEGLHGGAPGGTVFPMPVNQGAR